MSSNKGLEKIKELEEWVKSAELIETQIAIDDDQDPFGMDKCTNTWYTALYKKDNKYYAIYYYNDSPTQKNEVKRKRVIHIEDIYEYVNYP